ncbi:hypothetical protein [Tumebacillus lipolyticus]|uniref:Uncharacterized protein n=1 Tax=Tumebacillus lipolyticus TaxID=1280370 RepID=A0ABW4ZVR1_9BACL
MSTFWYKLGKQAFDKSWYFIAVWVAVFAIVLATDGIRYVHIMQHPDYPTRVGQHCAQYGKRIFFGEWNGRQS